MVKFIRQEMEEKANEIRISTDEEFNIEKLRLVEAEKKRRSGLGRKTKTCLGNGSGLGQLMQTGFRVWGSSDPI
ncbi:hypothetical protein Ddye_031842 [Dipteronia dyeriana]|uniref:Uncharacterized protein n=1 Tax=Dipteronia dyeriana TaxID=168575 RepID=A0AAD9WP42_9ROSI|nr:hypothetical protein Ddye_031842 [Dipteronia dyeriana]